MKLVSIFLNYLFKEEQGDEAAGHGRKQYVLPRLRINPDTQIEEKVWESFFFLEAELCFQLNFFILLIVLHSLIYIVTHAQSPATHVENHWFNNIRSHTV